MFGGKCCSDSPAMAAALARASAAATAANTDLRNQLARVEYEKVIVAAAGDHKRGGGIVDYYAVMPPDNATPIPVGGFVAFPVNGLNTGAKVVRTGAATFRIECPGAYKVEFQIAVTQPAQLVVNLNGVPISSTVVGGSAQIMGSFVIETVTPNSILAIQNPPGGAGPIVLTPFAGGIQPVSAHLLITQL